MPAVEAILFRETTTLGVRRWKVERHRCAAKRTRSRPPWGAVEGVLAWVDAGTARFSPEYEACRRVAEARKVPLRVVYEAAQAAYRAKS